MAGSGCIVRRGSKNICGLYEADNDVPTPLVATDTRGQIHTIYTATKVLGFQHLSSNGQWLIGMLAISTTTLLFCPMSPPAAAQVAAQLRHSEQCIKINTEFVGALA